MASDLVAGRNASLGRASVSLRISPWLRRARFDLVIGGVLAVVTVCIAYVGSSRLSPYLFDADMRGNDIWFQADVSRTYSNMVSTASDHYRSKVHPLFSIISLASVHGIARLLRLDMLTAVRVFGAVVAFLWGGSFFALLRVIGLRRVDSALFTLVCLSSAAALFWLPIPETYALGSLTIIWAMLLAAASERLELRERWFVAASVAAMSITVTNWMAAAATSLVYRKSRRTAIITAKAAVVLVIAGLFQRLVVPSAHVVFASREEARYVLAPQSGGPIRCMTSFFLHAMVAPKPLVSETEKTEAGIGLLLTQWSTPGRGTAYGLVALALWVALLALGVRALGRHPARRFCLALGLTLGGQLLLHAFYGGETFLYSIHFLPLLVVAAALATMTDARIPALFLAAALLAVALPNNVTALSQALAYVESASPARYQVLLEKSRRPADDWPRSQGHVLIAPPASRVERKGYLEPGGSFSPAPGTFGVSLSVESADGSTVTSNGVPLSQIEQKLVWADPAHPAIDTETPSYEANWQVRSEGLFSLDVRGRNSPARVWLMVRSVGPAGGPVKTLSWDGHRLSVNGSWSLTVAPAPREVWLGDEREPGWMHAQSRDASWSGNDGWGAARLELAAGAVHVDVADERPRRQESTPTRAADVRAPPEMDLPDGRFAASLKAQLAHLLMGIVEGETRPGDPVHYVAPWTRDGAYVAVALARAGQIEVARTLARTLAEGDFAGGFGAEADAPGLALWALGVIAEQAHDRDFDAWVWPHMRRKAEFILTMLDAGQDIRAEPVGPVLPETLLHHEDTTLVARAARDGLIVGRMDHHFPLLFVNAVSYLGLREAAAIADRAERPEDAARYTNAAAALRAAWSRALDTTEATNERTSISMLWPTNIASARDPRVRRLLVANAADGTYEKPPLWTYFEIAKAHQWLALGEPERAWATVRWFWDHQASPGLYTWWEGKGEENSSYGWEAIRGWVSPPYVTPHYWTAAEMLLLQLDMLVAVERVGDAPTVVVGAGVPREWLDHPMSVGLLPTVGGGKAAWSWDGRQLHVHFEGAALPVRLGPSFPPGVTIDVQ